MPAVQGPPTGMVPVPLEQVLPVQARPEQQSALVVQLVPVVWQLLQRPPTQVSAGLVQVIPEQHGAPSPPHTGAVARHVPLMHENPASQALVPQQAWPLPPQGVAA